MRCFCSKDSPEEGEPPAVFSQWACLSVGRVTRRACRLWPSQHRIWEKGCLSNSSALGRCFASTKMRWMKSRVWSEVFEGSMGLVGWVAILKMAAMASYSAQGGFSVSISTTVQPRLLEEDNTRPQANTRLFYDDTQHTSFVENRNKVIGNKTSRLEEINKELLFLYHSAGTDSTSFLLICSQAPLECFGGNFFPFFPPHCWQLNCAIAGSRGPLQSFISDAAGGLAVGRGGGVEPQSSNPSLACSPPPVLLARVPQGMGAWNIPTAVMSRLAGSYPITSLAWRDAAQSHRTGESLGSRWANPTLWLTTWECGSLSSSLIKYRPFSL